nr:adenylyltransferase/cytidyltransferase family protein [Ardenticatena sp.]
MGRILTLDDARREREALRAAGKRLVLTNGCFDLLHIGHLHSLRMAAAQGDVLWVGVNSDVAVRLLKGPKRPLVPWAERAELLSALEMVDAVIGFDEITAAHLLLAVRPDVYVKGGDYTPATLPEYHLARLLGADVVLVPPVAARSTSQLIVTIVERYTP